MSTRTRSPSISRYSSASARKSSQALRNSCVASAPVQHVEGERVLAHVEVRLGFEADFISPCILEVAEEFPQSIVPVVAAADIRKLCVELDARMACRDERLEVAGVPQLDVAAM